MEGFEWVEQVLHFAIGRELEAEDLYLRLARDVKKTRIRTILEELAVEESKHKAKLEAVKANQVIIDLEEVGSLGLAEKIESVDLRLDMSCPELLRLAMKKEDKSVKLYTKLAAATHQPQLKDMFQKLAQEEA